MRGATRAREREQAIIAAGWTRSSPTRYSSDEMQSGSKNCSGGPQSAFCHCVGRVAEWFKAAVLKTARGFTLPRGFESHPFRHITVAKRYNCTIVLCFGPRAPGSRPTGQGEAGRLPGPPRSPAVLKITPNWDELTPASAGLFFFTPGTRPVKRDHAGGATSALRQSPLHRN